MRDGKKTWSACPTVRNSLEGFLSSAKIADTSSQQKTIGSLIKNPTLAGCKVLIFFKAVF